MMVRYTAGNTVGGPENIAPSDETFGIQSWETPLKEWHNVQSDIGSAHLQIELFLKKAAQKRDQPPNIVYSPVVDDFVQDKNL